MSSIAPIKASALVSTTVLTTDAAAGAELTFSPDGFIAPGVARWVDRTGGIAVGYPAFTLNVRPPSKSSRLTKVTAKIVLPTLEQTSPSTATGIQPAPMKAYDCSAIIEVLIPERSTAEERETLLSAMKSFLFESIDASDGDPVVASGSPLVTAILDTEPPY